MASDPLSDLLECSICLEPLGLEHKVLPYQHTFCTLCLGAVWDRASEQLCPECRSVCPVSLCNLPSNVILNRILGMGSKRTGSCPGNMNARAEAQPGNVNTPPGNINQMVQDQLSKLSLTTSKIPGNPSTNPFLEMLSHPTTLNLSTSISKSANTSPSNPSLTLASPQRSPAPELPPKPGSLASFFPEIPKEQKPKVQEKASSAGHQIYRALFDYNPTKTDEIPLKKNELYIVVDKCQDGWYKGCSVQGLKTGVFPGNYVQHIQNDPGNNILQPVKAQNQPKKPSFSKDDLIDFEELLSEVKAEVRSEVTSGAATKGRRAAPVPNPTSNSSNPDSNLASNMASSNSGPNLASCNQGSNPVSVPSRAGASPIPPPPFARKKFKYKCIMSYPASTEYELDLTEGDVIVLLKKRDDGWCKGTLEKNGQTGLFPITFVQKINS